MENVTLTSRDKKSVQGQAEIIRYDSGARTRRSLPFLVGGFVVGACTIVIPGVHFVAPWLLPILGVVVYRYYQGIFATVDTVEADCPACGEHFAAKEVGNWEEPMHVRCTACRAPLAIATEEPIQ